MVPPGEEIELAAHDATALFQQGIGEPVRETREAAVTAPSETADRSRRKRRQKGRR
jgi:hypothetical protein